MCTCLSYLCHCVQSRAAICAKLYTAPVLQTAISYIPETLSSIFHHCLCCTFCHNNGQAPKWQWEGRMFMLYHFFDQSAWSSLNSVHIHESHFHNPSYLVAQLLGKACLEDDFRTAVVRELTARGVGSCQSIFKGPLLQTLHPVSPIRGRHAAVRVQQNSEASHDEKTQKYQKHAHKCKGCLLLQCQRMSNTVIPTDSCQRVVVVAAHLPVVEIRLDTACILPSAIQRNSSCG